jgi:hypothetical protein
MREVGRIGERCVNVIFCQLRIVIKNIRFRHAFGEAAQNNGDLNAGVRIPDQVGPRFRCDFGDVIGPERSGAAFPVGIGGPGEAGFFGRLTACRENT